MARDATAPCGLDTNCRTLDAQGLQDPTRCASADERLHLERQLAHLGHPSLDEPGTDSGLDAAGSSSEARLAQVLQLLDCALAQEHLRLAHLRLGDPLGDLRAAHLAPQAR